MSSVRVSVEWMFGSICNYFALIDMKKQQKINLSAIGKIYIVSSLLQNAHTCLYGVENLREPVRGQDVEKLVTIKTQKDVASTFLYFLVQ